MMKTLPQFKIIDLNYLDEDLHHQAAHLLLLGFAHDWPNAWPTLETALDEVKETLGEEKICRLAVTESGEVIGWIGGFPQYDGQTWELHPIVVHPEYQGVGIGTALVLDFEDQVRKRGATTIFLGTDDESEMTSLGGIDLYPDVLEHLSSLKSRRSHPFEFYQKLGYSVVGVIPDANGPGKPDIIITKRVES